MLSRARSSVASLVNTFAAARSFAAPRRHYGDDASMKKTALFDLNVELGGKMVPFAGYMMPVQFPDGILASHLHVREKSGLFDVSHMGQLRLTGKDRVAFLEYITVADVQSLPEFHGMYSLMPNAQGGLIDDTIVTNAKDFLYVVVNAGCFDKDWKHIKSVEAEWKAKGKDITVEVWANRSLIALQGPASEAALQRHTKTDLSRFKFFTGGFIHVDGVECYIQRSGYTGEDGFELSTPTPAVVKITRSLLTEPEVKPAGLGPRDSLRLEAGLPLYGNDLDEKTTPKQANLVWTISNRRQQQGGFIGDKTILAELPGKIADLPKRRIGLFIDGSPAREHTTVHDPATGAQVGEVTSGTFSPSLKRAIAMAYVKPPFHKMDGRLHVNVRGKMREAVVTKMPFVPTSYKN